MLENHFCYKPYIPLNCSLAWHADAICTKFQWKKSFFFQDFQKSCDDQYKRIVLVRCSARVLIIIESNNVKTAIKIYSVIQQVPFPSPYYLERSCLGMLSMWLKISVSGGLSIFHFFMYFYIFILLHHSQVLQLCF